MNILSLTAFFQWGVSFFFDGDNTLPIYNMRLSFFFFLHWVRVWENQNFRRKKMRYEFFFRKRPVSLMAMMAFEMKF